MLRVEGFSYRPPCAGSRVLEGIDLELAAGRVLLLTGPSGSGKSTLLAAIGGLIPHYHQGERSGTIRLDGRSPEEETLLTWGARVGLMLQNPEAQFLGSTVGEEIYLALKCRNLPEPQARLLTAGQLRRFGLEAWMDMSVFSLSEGQKQKTVLAGLTALKPRLLLLDEPAANLDPESAADLADILKSLKREGLSLIIADHHLSWLRELVDQVLVLKQGRVAARGDMNLLADPCRRDALGLRSFDPLSRLTAASVKPRPAAGEAGIVAEGIWFGFEGRAALLRDVSAFFLAGRVTAVLGPNGCGKTTLGRILCGLETPHRGQVKAVGWEKPNPLPPHCQMVLQNADHQLFMPQVRAEIALALCDEKRSDPSPEVHAILAAYGLGDLAARHPQSLSGGEKQRLTIAAAMAALPALLVLDEPTSGLDRHNLQLMIDHIRGAAARGTAVVVITHDMELAAGCADLILNL